MAIPKNGEYVLKMLRMDDHDGNDVIRGRTWLQKMMYAGSKDHRELDYGFVPHSYGMYSRSLADIVDNLETEGLVCTEKPEEGNRSPMHLTRAGRTAADGVTGCNPDVLETLRSVKTALNSLDYRELVVLMYFEYPEMLQKTSLRDKYENWREDGALSMVSKEKISFSLGASISGLDKETFRARLGALESMPA